MDLGDSGETSDFGDIVKFGSVLMDPDPPSSDDTYTLVALDDVDFY